MIQTKYGFVEGVQKDGCTVYMGIPFAKPPVGELAFRHPEKPEDWTGVLKADHGSHNPIQIKSKFACGNMDLDCLYLNIFVPEQKPEGALPVMVWVYGGAYETGGAGANEEGSQELAYDLALFARETKTIVVSFNYRLNLYGFLNLHYLDEKYDQNNGLYDQLMALQFVQENIAAFGGDPNNVTLFGQSAGAACILALMSMEEGKGLFHRTIVQSPCIEHFFTEEESRKNTRHYLKTAGVKDPSQLEELSMEELTEINEKYSSSVRMKGELRCAFSPVIDGVTLKQAPMDAASHYNLPMVIGSVKEEGNIFVPDVPAVAFPIAALYLHLEMKKEDASFRQRFSDTLTDHIYERPITEMLSFCPCPTWRYEYRYTTPESKYGCCHISELPVLFGNYITLDGIYDPDAKPVGDRLRKIWGDFAHTGNPGWEENDDPRDRYFID